VEARQINRAASGLQVIRMNFPIHFEISAKAGIWWPKPPLSIAKNQIPAFAGISTVP
jgi:hypothetical protein